MGRSKLTDADRAEIRKMAKEGHSQSALAKLFGVSQMTIHRTLNPDYYARTLESSKAYQRENAEQIQERRASRRDYRLSLSPENDSDLIAHLDKKENVTEYIRNLLKEDLKKEGR